MTNKIPEGYDRESVWSCSPLNSIKGAKKIYTVSQLEEMTSRIREATEKAAEKSCYKNVKLQTQFPFELSGKFAWQIIYDNPCSVFDEDDIEKSKNGFMIYADAETGEFSFDPEYETTKDPGKMLETIEKLLCPQDYEEKKAS